MGVLWYINRCPLVWGKKQKEYSLKRIYKMLEKDDGLHEKYLLNQSKMHNMQNLPNMRNKHKIINMHDLRKDIKKNMLNMHDHMQN